MRIKIIKFKINQNESYYYYYNIELIGTHRINIGIALFQKII